MAKASTEKPGGILGIWNKFSRIWSASVPDELSPCEFDCRKTECLQGDWERCRQRLEQVRMLSTARAAERENPPDV
ncbi:hypothetical protein [Thiocystis violascens]|uniref:hypothetical protein n=1 Tax=Thiocystis violascens TaxID=73141 RepID=UPI00059BFA8F|nr:hypothetical protein [Thiocystis violascens]